MWSGSDYENHAFHQYAAYGGIGGPGTRSGRFEEHYRCYSVAMMQGNERENVNYGGKIILPPSALAKLASLQIMYPMLFQISNEGNGKTTSAGVLEFIAEEGRVYMPHWMMKTLSLEQGQIVQVVNATLPTGTFVKIQPQSVDFLDITDPKAVLENALRNFSTLTQGDIIEFLYNSKVYRIFVMEIKPNHSGSISILETDLEVDFAPPVGYEEPKPVQKNPLLDPMAGEPIQEEELGWRSFRGTGNRLSGKAAPETMPIPVGAVAPTGPTNMVTTADLDRQDTAPAALNMPFGQLFFGYKMVPLKANDGDDSTNATLEESGKAFQGQGQTLRVRRPGSNVAGSSRMQSASASTELPVTKSPAPPQTAFEGKGNTLK